MNECRPPFLLLDPPSAGTFCRRGTLREKDTAADAPFPSLDLILLSGAVRDAGYEPVYIDAQLDKLSWSALIERLRKMGVAGMVALTSSGGIDGELAELRQVKQALGGIHCYIVGTIIIQLENLRLRGLMLENPWLDGAILNTTEHNFADVIARDCVKEVEPLNIALNRGGQVIIPEARVSYGGSLRIPRPQHAIFKDRRYCFPQSKRGPVTCTQLSFGCPYQCEFCIDNQQYRRTLYRDVNDVIEELVEMDRLGFREFYLKDLVFGLDRKTTTRFLTELIERRLRLRWLCTTRVDVVNFEILALMKQAGCYGIEFGVEHAHEHVRRRVGKNITDEQLFSVFQECRRIGIETTAFMMLAFEDDTIDDVRATIRFAQVLNPDYVSFNVANALPGTAYEARARGEGFLRENCGDYAFSSGNIRHRHLSPEQVEELRREAVASFYKRPSMIVKKLLRTRSLFELRKLVRLGLSL